MATGECLFAFCMEPLPTFGEVLGQVGEHPLEFIGPGMPLLLFIAIGIIAMLTRS